MSSKITTEKGFFNLDHFVMIRIYHDEYENEKELIGFTPDGDRWMISNRPDKYDFNYIICAHMDND